MLLLLSWSVRFCGIAVGECEGGESSVRGGLQGRRLVWLVQTVLVVLHSIRIPLLATALMEADDEYGTSMSGNLMFGD